MSERRKQCGASKRVSSASERANGRASGPVHTSGFLVTVDHSRGVGQAEKERDVVVENGDEKIRI